MGSLNTRELGQKAEVGKHTMKDVDLWDRGNNGSAKKYSREFQETLTGERNRWWGKLAAIADDTLAICRFAILTLNAMMFLI